MPPEPPADPAEPAESPDPEPAAPARGRGAARRPKAADARAARRISGHTIYLPDDLFERILVQSHRRRKTISEYVTALLERQVPDHRTVARPEPAEGESAA